jgi:subtilisin
VAPVLRLLGALLALLVALPAAAVAHARLAAPVPPASGYVVALHGDATADTVRELEFAVGFQVVHRYRSALQGFSARLTDAQVAGLRARRGVALVTPDVEVRASGLVPVARGETIPAGVRRIGAATTTEVRAPSDVGVAVLDTGLDLANPDLNATTGTNCVRPGASAQDDHGHGTHVGGVLAARNSGAGVAGVAAGTRLHAVKVLGAKGSGTLSQLLCGIDWVTREAGARNIRVANMSIEGAGTDDGNCGWSNGDLEHRAICASVDADVTYVASAGNSGRDLATTIPATYAEVLTVTAMTDTDGVAGGKGPVPCSKAERDDVGAGWSNFATTAGDAAHVLAAPGTCVVSSRRGGGTTTMSGTSMAAPHVAGAAALCLAAGAPCAGLPPTEVARRLRDDAADAAATLGFSGDPLRPLAGKVLGHLVSARGL